MKKIPSWELWDWISIRKSLFFVIISIVVITFLFEFPNLIHYAENRDKTMRTQGFVSQYTAITSVHQGKFGNKTITDAYEIKYWYTVNNKNYNGTDIVPTSMNSKYIARITYEGKSNVKVEYNPEKPEESALVIE